MGGTVDLFDRALREEIWPGRAEPDDHDPTSSRARWGVGDAGPAHFTVVVGAGAAPSGGTTLVWTGSQVPNWRFTVILV